MSTPVLHVLAGPNGSGKSTFAHRVLMPVTHLPFVNADELAAQHWPGNALAHAYEASALAARLRAEYLQRRTSFLTETVFSHPSKVELVRVAAGAGYLVHLHVMLLPLSVTEQRVGYRVGGGGHAVPAVKIRERYARLWALVAQARGIADRATFYDNSRAAAAFRVVARYERGQPSGRPDWPAWTPTELTSP